VVADYDRYEFHPIVAQLQAFAAEDLGAFYLDVLKDRLYTTPAGSHARRSAQTALALITETLLTLSAPILSFTAEEAWKVFKRRNGGTIFTEVWSQLPAVEGEDALLGRWETIRAIRAEVMKRIEEQRAAGALGSSLQAEIEIHLTAERAAILRALGDDLRFVMITSAAHVVQVDHADEETVVVRSSAHLKCDRCWHWRSDVGADSGHPTICGRCVSNLFGAGEARTVA